MFKDREAFWTFASIGVDVRFKLEILFIANFCRFPSDDLFVCLNWCFEEFDWELKLGDEMVEVDVDDKDDDGDCRQLLVEVSTKTKFSDLLCWSGDGEELFNEFGYDKRHEWELNSFSLWLESLDRAKIKI